MGLGSAGQLRRGLSEYGAERQVCLGLVCFGAEGWAGEACWGLVTQGKVSQEWFGIVGVDR